MSNTQTFNKRNVEELSMTVDSCLGRIDQIRKLNDGHHREGLSNTLSLFYSELDYAAEIALIDLGITPDGEEHEQLRKYVEEHFPESKMLQFTPNDGGKLFGEVKQIAIDNGDGDIVDNYQKSFRRIVDMQQARLNK